MTAHVRRVATIAAMSAAASLPTFAQNIFFTPGNLVVSRSVYTNNKNNVTIGQTLPPNCVVSTGSCVTATNNGLYPFVFNNALVDGSFGITSKIFLDHITTAGTRISSQQIPNNPAISKNILVTSFSSKSELALNLSLDHKYITFMGYAAPVAALDVSNSNTPGVVDPTNPVGTNVYRAVAQIDQFGFLQYTLTNAYSGNNGRAAILNNFVPAYYTAGNAGNGSNPQPDGIILGAGAQFISPVNLLQPAQNPGTPTPVGSFNITQLGDKADKIGKDTNFRGLTIFNNVLYTTKGSGGNGVNTVYFVDTTGTVCNNSTGVGLPAPGAALPTAPMVYNPANVQTMGVEPFNMCILKGFPTATKSTTSFPFGVWFANANTLYVADEGDGTNTYANGMYTAAAASTTAGLQKWIFNSSSGEWTLAYTLQTGLNLGVPNTIKNYPTGNNPATGLPWAPGTDGLRNITGMVNGDGTATIYAITSTVSGGGDQGADPNMLVKITDNIAATTQPAGESFSSIYSAGFGEVLRGVSFTPGTNGI